MLAEIRDMLDLRVDGRFKREKWMREAQAKLESIERKLEELRELKGLLGRALARCIDPCFEAGCEILDGAAARKHPEPSGAEEAGHPQQGPVDMRPTDCCSSTGSLQ